MVWTLPALSNSTSAEAIGVKSDSTKDATAGSGNSPQTTSSADKIKENTSEKQETKEKIQDFGEKIGGARKDMGITREGKKADVPV